MAGTRPGKAPPGRTYPPSPPWLSWVVVGLVVSAALGATGVLAQTPSQDPAASAAPSTTASHPLLVAVAPHLPDGRDGGFAIGAPREFDLGGFSVRDARRAWTLPAGALAGPTPVWLMANASAWQEFGGPAALTLPGLETAATSGSLQLVDPMGRPIDAFAWGSARVAGMDNPMGHVPHAVVYRRLPAVEGEMPWRDTDSKSDWATPRIHRVGESSLAATSFQVPAVTLYASPDSSFHVLKGLIGGATKRLHLHVYEFTSPILADAIVERLSQVPGLDVQVLVTGAPVGLAADQRHMEADALSRIQAAGGRVVVAHPGRYAHHHLKVLVADDDVAVQSENWVPSGVPSDPSWGNRGWGAVLHDGAAAAWFATWMAGDRDAWDAEVFDLESFDPGFETPPRFPARSGSLAPRADPLRIVGPFEVRPIVAPDMVAGLDPIGQVAAGARSSVLAQQLQLNVRATNRLGWEAPDPLVAALGEAARRGAQVRVIAAPPFGASDEGNVEALEALRQAGAEAKEGDRPGIATWHNKGLVVDGRWVVLGSINGGHASRTANREVSLLLDAPPAARYYADLFEADWDGVQARDWGVPGQDLRGLPMAPLPMLLAALGVALALGRRA